MSKQNNIEDLKSALYIYCHNVDKLQESGVLITVSKEARVYEDISSIYNDKLFYRLNVAFYSSIKLLKSIDEDITSSNPAEILHQSHLKGIIEDYYLWEQLYNLNLELCNPPINSDAYENLLVHDITQNYIGLFVELMVEVQGRLDEEELKTEIE